MGRDKGRRREGQKEKKGLRAEQREEVVLSAKSNAQHECCAKRVFFQRLELLKSGSWTRWELDKEWVV